jgi:hypothetical protein
MASQLLAAWVREHRQIRSCPVKKNMKRKPTKNTLEVLSIEDPGLVGDGKEFGAPA